MPPMKPYKGKFERLFAMIRNIKKPPVHLGNSLKKNGIKSSGAIKGSDIIRINTDPRQEYWSGMPPKRHHEPGWDTIPAVREYLKSGKRFPKYVFPRAGPNLGRRVFLYYTK